MGGKEAAPWDFGVNIAVTGVRAGAWCRDQVSNWAGGRKREAKKNVVVAFSVDAVPWYVTWPRLSLGRSAVHQPASLGPDKMVGWGAESFRVKPTHAHACCASAPRIPPDKRIFTTRHTPSCLFQDVDERCDGALREAGELGPRPGAF